MSVVFSPNCGSKRVSLQDFDKISISGVSGDYKVNLVISYSGKSATISGSYTAVNGSIIIADLPDLLIRYFNEKHDDFISCLSTFGIHSTYSDEVSLKVQLYQNGDLVATSNEYFVVYTNVLMNKLNVPVQLDQSDAMFLARQTIASLDENGVGCVGAYAVSAKLQAQIRILNNFGECKRYSKVIAEFGVPTALFPYIYTFSWQYLIEEVFDDVLPEDTSFQNLKQIEFNLIAGEEVVDSITFNACANRKFREQFAFIGACGEPEIVSMIGSKTVTPEMDPSFIVSNDNYKKTETSFVVTQKVFSGPIAPATRNLIYDLVNSPHVWKYNCDNWEEITVTDFELEERNPRLSPIGLSFTYRVADNRKQRTFERL